MGNNNIKTLYSYDYANRLTSLRSQTSNGNTISEYTSEYLDNGQKSKEISVVLDKDGKKRTNEKEYVYDLLGRITKEPSI